MITLADQIACVKREIAMRKSVYPKWVRLGKMTEEKAAREIEVMQSVLDTLIGIQEGGQDAPSQDH